MDELTILEEKIDKMIDTINELKRKIHELAQENNALKSRGTEAKKRVNGLIEKLDSSLI